VLSHGDQIEVGSSLFVFLTHEAIPSELALSQQVETTDFRAKSTLRLPTVDGIYLNREKIVGMLPPTAATATKLSTLLKFSQSINSIQSKPNWEHSLLELIFDSIPARRVAIFFMEDGFDGLSPGNAWNHSLEKIQVHPLMRQIAKEVLKERVGRLSHDVIDTEPSAGTEHIEMVGPRSLICVPFSVFNETLAVLYLDTADTRDFFDEDHLQFITATASIAAVALSNIRHLERYQLETDRLRSDLSIEHNLVGESPVMARVYQLIAKLAETDSTVLIQGENGTGKELAARAIHQNSARVKKPFVAINCAALVDSLLESELFGHERGAFTGAIAQKKGKLEMADQGTIFLDEVSELSPAFQSKLLRVLQEREFERVGGTRPIHIDVRFIAATNRNLKEATRQGSFREDLFYRLNVVTLNMPSLRERGEDITLLANYFAAKYCKKLHMKIKRLSPEASRCLNHYDWPGNVRELENAIERAVVLGSGDAIRPEDLPEDIVESGSVTATDQSNYHQALVNAKRVIILKAIEQAKGNVCEAAKLLGIHNTYLYRLVRKLNLEEIEPK
jgi:Nif-specific regulatory protein